MALNFSSKFISLTRALDSANSKFKISPYEIEKKDLQQLDSINTLKQKQAVQAATIKQDNIMLWISLVAILIISVSLWFVYRQYRTNKKTLQVLQTTQRQLVLSEKMASLGELTAGIAHEIQNPLNFVNNFSEVNVELLAEMKTEIDKGNLEEVKLLAQDVIENSKKITHHGKRAGGIVSGMLQHSRTSSGKREPTDINALADEYLRLAYHGLRAKDKSFNAEMKVDFDQTIGHINIVPQDIGRVILNLITNAFYVVTEKSKNPDPLAPREALGVPDGGTGRVGYEPTVLVRTAAWNPPSGSPSASHGGRGVQISVKDNGNGIPQNILDKIFQPFFTTKPTGQGTGLGLSLSYDIVKAHGGELRVETKEGEGSEFVIQLPVV
jgi:two-component system, NtrC family, sensor kinase